ncbi:unnamed protein product [Linum tenue]|uniref:Protein CASP n=1 Tax=Linum tenue TaxID=586396 RepID=A0AAV0MWR7_9ROSI|nr:unnamed protein product [Linum tenue]
MESTPQGVPERDKPGGPTSSPVSVVSNFWKEFDLEKEKSVLDEQGLRIAENQENSQKNRRKLAESTRDFKKASSEEKLGLFNSLLKGYQEEVDNLTKRAKFGENSFLNIYQKLYEAPDPYPALASISELDLKLSELESENRKMRLELEEFRTEATHLKNQQATIRRLEERNRQLELQMEEKVKEIVEMKQRSLAEENQKTLEVLKDREQSLQDQLRQAKESVSNMQKLHELAQSQLFIVQAQSDEESAAKQSEVNLLMDEVERAQTRLLSLEREKGVLWSQLQSANEDTGNKRSDNLDSSSMLENSLSAKEKIISELNMELHKIETTLANEREQHINEIKRLNALINEKDVAIQDVKKELQARPTPKLVDDLRKKVKILQAVGYNSIEAEDWEVATSGEEMSKMESLLLDKNRRMEHQVTQLKVQLSEKSSLLDTADSKIVELTSKVNEQQKLIQKLEDDILKGYGSKDRKGSLFEDWDLSEASGAESSELHVYCNNPDGHPGWRLHGLDTSPFSVCFGIDTSLFKTKFENGMGEKRSREACLSNFIAFILFLTCILMQHLDQKHVSSDRDQSSMLKVICNQRDRFRARLNEAEEEIRQLKERIGALTQELEKSKADNVKLYGKMRYVQDYNLEKVVSRGASKKHAEDLESGSSSDVESKYKKIYEDDINPFAAFSKKERDQRYKELGFRDRITLSSGRFVMGNKYARTFAFFYTIGLHVLVFSCLYRMSALSYLGNGEESLVVDQTINLPHAL